MNQEAHINSCKGYQELQVTYVQSLNCVYQAIHFGDSTSLHNYSLVALHGLTGTGAETEIPCRIAP